MPVAFPNLKPSERDYKPPSHAVTTLRAQNGVVSRRLWGTAPGSASLSLQFRHIHTDKAADIVKAWLDSKSGVDTVILPSSVFSGIGTKLKDIMLPTNGALSWTFAEAPSVVSVGPIWANVTVQLIGELRMS